MMTAHYPHSTPCTKFSPQELKDSFVRLALLRFCFHGNIKDVVLLGDDFPFTFRHDMHFNIHPVVEFQVVSPARKQKYPSFVLIPTNVNNHPHPPSTSLRNLKFHYGVHLQYISFIQKVASA